MAFSVTFNEAEHTLSRDELQSALTSIANLGPGKGLAADMTSIFKAVDLANLPYPSARAQELLNQLAPQINASDDMELVGLFHRAVRQHNTLAPEASTDPFPTFYRHYCPPPFLIPKTDLTLDVQEDRVAVHSSLHVRPQAGHASLVLDGRDHEVESVSLNGELLPPEQYTCTKHELIIFGVPTEEEFHVEVKSHINPYDNQSAEGLYPSGNLLTTQCESEGARRIFFGLDRPDVLSRYTTTIIADADKYPVRISNGNFVEETEMPDGRKSITWDDPFPKPSYLFATVMGDMGKLTDTYVTKSGRKVIIEAYAPMGKEDRTEFALWSMKKAMQFDEENFDREYDLDYLKMVAIEDYNMGAMENKGLIVFNADCMLATPETATDRDYRWIALVIAHEYFHNWSGNRVTVRNWFELALKEAFTDFRASLFCEWVWGKQFARISDIQELKEDAFPKTEGKLTHNIVVESYVDSGDIYDDITYTFGREVFRVLRTMLDHGGEEIFRKAQNYYFSKYDGQAVTFRHLLDAVVTVTGKDLTSYERWFHQAGTPTVSAKMTYDAEKEEAKLVVKQSCPHPLTGEAQPPCYIPLSVELVGKFVPKQLFPTVTFDFDKEAQTFTFHNVLERPIPVLMHDLGAPVKVEYPYTDGELLTIAFETRDPYCRWEAGQTFLKNQLRKLLKDEIGAEPLSDKEAEAAYEAIQEFARFAVTNTDLPPHAAAQLLTLPSSRALMEGWDTYYYPQAEAILKKCRQELQAAIARSLPGRLGQIPEADYRPMTDEFVDDMAGRMLLHKLMSYQVYGKQDEETNRAVLKSYRKADNFNDRLNTLNLLVELESEEAREAVANFGTEWAHDKTIFSKWIRACAGIENVTVDDMERIRRHLAFDFHNPNHLRAWLGAFVGNIGQFHQASGQHYAYVTDKILEVAAFNGHVASRVAENAFKDFPRLPIYLKEQMAVQLKRIKDSSVADASLRNIAITMLQG